MARLSYMNAVTNSVTIHCGKAWAHSSTSTLLMAAAGSIYLYQQQSVLKKSSLSGCVNQLSELQQYYCEEANGVE
jgi:hypothetical protein